MRALWLFCFFLAANLRAADPAEYCPVREGTEWIMDAKVTMPDGRVINTTAHRTIGAREERNGKTYYRMRKWMDDVPEVRPLESLERLDSTGLFSLDLRNPEAKEALTMALPFAVGSKWTWETGKAPITLEVVGLEDLTINGTTYKNCYHIKATTKDGSYAEDLWRAPGIGSIKSDIVLSAGTKISVSLREFKPGKAGP